MWLTDFQRGRCVSLCTPKARLPAFFRPTNQLPHFFYAEDTSDVLCRVECYAYGFCNVLDMNGWNRECVRDRMERGGERRTMRRGEGVTYGSEQGRRGGQALGNACMYGG